MTDRISENEIEAAWRRARPMSGRNPLLYRIAPDVIQSIIRRDGYGIRGEFGWLIEHGRPVAFRDITTETAIRALQRELVQPDDRKLRAAGRARGSRS